MLRIKFSDTDWIDSNGKTLKMSVEKEFLTSTRLTHNYIPPVTTMDNWGGETFPVQINQWEGYLIELMVQELAISMMSKMIACRTISIEDLSTGEFVTIDTQSEGAISLEAGDRFGTSAQSFNLIVKARKIKTYPGIAVDNTNTLQIIDPTLPNPLNFTTDRKLIYFVTDPDKSDYQKDSGLTDTSRTLSKNGVKMVFYLMESNAIILKRKIENIGYTSIKINPNTDNLLVAEIGKCTLTQLPEGLYKCECEFILTPNLMYA